MDHGRGRKAMYAMLNLRFGVFSVILGLEF